MPQEIRISPAAKRDLLKHFIYIGRQRVSAAKRFLRAADKAMDTLARMPEIGGIWESDNPGLAGLRMWAIRKFENHVIFYRLISGGIEIIRVLHGAQDVERLLQG